MKRIIALSFLFLSLSTSAEFLDGNTLKQLSNSYSISDKRKTTSTEAFDTGRYMGYLAGVIDSYAGIFFCPPDNMTLGQAGDIVMKYLNEHPEQKAKSGQNIVILSLSPVFPCKNDNK